MKRSIFMLVVLGFLAAFLQSSYLQAQEASTTQKPKLLSPMQGIQVPPVGEKDRISSPLIVPLSINYQGRLTNSAGTPITVLTFVDFNIYDGPGGGAVLLYSQLGTPVTPDGQGFYNISLGPLPANLFDAVPRWLGVTVPPDPEMTPRQEFQSVAYAINADRLGGLTSGDYVQKAGDVMTGPLGILASPFGELVVNFDSTATTAWNFFINGNGNQVAVDGYYPDSRFTAADALGGPAGGTATSVASTGYSTGGSTSSTGLYGYAAGSSINRAVHGQALGGTENWSGYFTDAPVRVGAGGLGGVNTATGAGDLYVADNLEVDGSITFPPGATAAVGSVDLGGFTASATPATLDQFTVTVPGPGFLLVTISGQWWYDADAGGAGSLTTFFEMGLCDAPASSGTCDGTYDSYYYQDADNISSNNSTHGFSITRVVPVVAGPRVFYWNADNLGTGFTIFDWGAKASVVFVPASLPVTSPAPETPQAPRRQQE